MTSNDLRTGNAETLIRAAESPQDMEIVRTLFREYAAAIGVDLCFQGFEEELRTLPGLYAPPRGRILLATCGDEPAGCVALRPLIGQTQHGATPAPCAAATSPTDTGPQPPSAASHQNTGPQPPPAACVARSPSAGSSNEGPQPPSAASASSALCEMKRLYVRPAYRSTGLGRRLAAAILEAGRELGYNSMYLDTLESMTAARRLYESLGFRDISAYYNNPLTGVRFYALSLFNARQP